MPINKLQISIFVIWLFHLAGIIGMRLGFYDFFLPKTWLTLVLSATLLLLNSSYDRRVYLLFIVFCIGFAAEAIGVATGAVFGNYAYGDNLGMKAVGVPLVIGINWLMLGLLARTVSQSMTSKIGLRIVLSSAIMVAIDFLIEPVAPKFDYWAFEGGLPTWQNYLGWFLVALPLQYILEMSGVEPSRKFAWHLLFAQIVFFMTFWNV